MLYSSKWRTTIAPLTGPKVLRVSVRRAATQLFVFGDAAHGPSTSIDDSMLAFSSGDEAKAYLAITK